MLNGRKYYILARHTVTHSMRDLRDIDVSLGIEIDARRREYVLGLALQSKN